MCVGSWLTRGIDRWIRPLISDMCVSVWWCGDVQEIPLLQLMGALYMGNKVTFKGDSRVNVVMEQVRRPRSRHTPPLGRQMDTCGEKTFSHADGPTGGLALRRDRTCPPPLYTQPFLCPCPCAPDAADAARLRPALV